MSLEDWPIFFFTRIVKAKNKKVDTKGMVKGQNIWHSDNEKLLIGVGVSRLEESEDEDIIRMKSHVKTVPSMCMGITYTSMKVLLRFLILSMIFLQVYLMWYKFLSWWTSQGCVKVK